MHYNKNSITAFLDGVAPFDDAKAIALRANTVVRHMAEDIEELHLKVVAQEEIIAYARKHIRKQNTLIGCVGAGVIIGGICWLSWKETKRLEQKED